MVKSESFGDGVILNDYDGFIEKSVEMIKDKQSRQQDAAAAEEKEDEGQTNS